MSDKPHSDSERALGAMVDGVFKTFNEFEKRKRKEATNPKICGRY